MSKTKELASDCGLCDIDPSGRAITDYGDHTEELMAFYHAVRAEAMREAAKSCHQVGQQPSTLWQEPGCWAHSAECCAAGISAMADREGKE